MVDLVHVLVESPVMQQLVDPVVPRVLNHQTHNHLQAENVPEEKGDK